MSTTLLVSALLAGLVGGLHCAAMCGGFVTAIAARDSAGVLPMLPARLLVFRQLGYHAGRVASYAALGAAFGAAGAATVDAVNFLPAQQTLYVVANGLLLVLAVSVATRRSAMPWLTRAGMGAFALVLPWASPLTRGPRPAGRFALGALWGLVPCTLVYSVLPLALFAGGAWQGGAVMLAFGLGTLPHLAGFGWALQRARHLARGTGARYLAASVMTGFALVGIYRALYLPGTLAQGPFCLVP
jgi:sulfite exporter TauE/SafE